MPELEQSRPARPALAFRLGITGARNLQAEQLGRIADELEAVFALVKSLIAPEDDAEANILLLTPLARGADRLAARVALAEGFQIFVPMPFAQAEYERDFVGVPHDSEHAIAITADEELQEFRELLAEASGKLELNGHRGSDGSGGEAYEGVGRYVVNHCDLLIAIWNGQPGNGRGGTAEIVQFAVEQGRPLWWIHASEARPAKWLEGTETGADGPEAETKLKEWLKQRLAAK